MLVTKLVMPVPEEAEPLAEMDVSGKWNDGLNVNAPRIQARRQLKIRNRSDYEHEIAVPSTERMAEFINPAFVSDSDRTFLNIISAHEKNTAEGYKKWKKALDFVFSTQDGVAAKIFRDFVSAKKDNIVEELSRRSWRFTGSRVGGLGVAPIASYWLVGYKRTAAMLPGGSVVAGGPYLITHIGQRTAFKAALQQMLIQAGILVVLGNYQPAVFAEQNSRLNHLCQSLINPALGLTPLAPSGLSHIDYKLINERLHLDIQIDQI